MKHKYEFTFQSFISKTINCGKNIKFNENLQCYLCKKILYSMEISNMISVKSQNLDKTLTLCKLLKYRYTMVIFNMISVKSLNLEQEVGVLYKLVISITIM